MITDVEHLFMYLLIICMFSLKMSIQVICPFLIILFLLLSCISPLYILNINLFRFIFGKYILPFNRLSICFVKGFFQCATGFYFYIIPFIYFLFCCPGHKDIQINITQISVIAYFSVFYSRTFLVSGLIFKSSVQFSSVTQLCPTLCDPMNRSTPGLPVHHQLPEFTQTHIHQVSDAIQPSHPLSSPFPPAPNPSQHQSLFQWVNSSHEVAKVLEFQL